MPFVDAAGVQVNFPFEPYQCQKDYMDRVVQCLREGVNGILESPTGTGKTLSLLCSSLAWLEGKKAQISSQRWQMSKSEEGSIEHYQNVLAKQLDSAAGAWAGEMAAPKIIYASRTHTQLSQAVAELKRTAYSHFKVCVLGSREQLCIHPQVMKEENNTTKVHLCRAKISAHTCHFYNNVEQGKSNFSSQVMDIEDLVQMGTKLKCCPYYVTKELKNEADVIFMPYNYLLDPKARRAHGVELQGNVIIFDEAHNLEKMCEESASFDWTSGDIASAIRDLKELSDKLSSQISAEENGAFDMSDSQVTSALDFTMREVYELKAQLLELEEKIDTIEINKAEGIHKPGHFIFELFNAVNLNFNSKHHISDLLDKIVTYLTSESTSTFHSRGNGLSKYADVIKIAFSRDMSNEYASMSAHQKHVSRHYKVHIKQNAPKPSGGAPKKTMSWGDKGGAADKGGAGAGRTLSYWCFSSGHTMEELQGAGVRSIILTSGTLSPLESFTTEMGIKFPVTLENPHVIEPHQVWIGIIGKGPDGTVLNSSYEHRFKESYQGSLGHAVVNFSRIVPHGLLLFFPSYPVMNKCLEHWQERNMWSRMEQYKPVYVEPRGKRELQSAMINYYDKIHDNTANGAIFAAVCRGKVSEGLDFADRNGRAVVITGLPFPPRMDPKVVLKMAYLDETRRNGGKGLSGQVWYRQQASRAVNQAIGRVIRHKDDYGAIILCDTRFNGSSAQAELPVWVRPYVKSYQQFGVALKDMMAFFKTAEKNLPVAGESKPRKSSAAGSGCQGAYFEPTLHSTRNHTAGTAQLRGASHIISHVPSLQQEEVSLAKLKMQYESTEATEFSQRVDTGGKGLLGALSSKRETRVFDVRGIDTKEKPSTSTSTSTSSTQQLRTKKKILIKSRTGDSAKKSEVTSGGLQTAEHYLAEVKSTLSSESYKMFSSILGDYKKTENFDTMVATLADIFTSSQQNYHLFRKFYRFVRPGHKEKFDKMCRDILGQGCGYKPEHSIQGTKRSSAPSQGNEEKKCKLDSNGLSSTSTPESEETKASNKTNSVSALKEKLNSATSLNTVELKEKTNSVSALIPSELEDKKSLITSGPVEKTSEPLSRDVTNLQAAADNRWTESEATIQLDVKSLLASTKKSGHLCCHCKSDAVVPVKSKCSHIGCFQCWKTCVKESKPCPECGFLVRRKHLTRILFY